MKRYLFRFWLSLFVFLIGFLFAQSGQMQAAVIWDYNANSTPNPADGNGTWDSSTLNWFYTPTSTLYAWPQTNGGQAVFGSGSGTASYTIAISGFTPNLKQDTNAATQAALTFASQNYTINGGGLNWMMVGANHNTQAGWNFANIASGVTATVNAPITWSLSGAAPTTAAGDIVGQGTLNLGGGLTAFTNGSTDPQNGGIRIGTSSSDNPTVNFTGGTFTAGGTNYKGLSVAPVAGSSGTLNIKGNSNVNFVGSAGIGWELTVSNGGTAVCRVQDSANVTFTTITVGGNGNAAGSGVLDLSGGNTTATNLNFGRAAGGNYAATGTLNLNSGAVLNVGKISKAGSNCNATFNFDGGVLKPTSSNTNDFWNNVLNSVYVKNGGAIVDTNGYDIAIAQPLLQGSGSTGGLTKQGSGVLTLSGTNTYTGNTSINNGTLALAAGGTIANSNTIRVGANSTLDASTKSVWTVGSGQTLDGNGTVIVGSTLAVNGHLTPGTSGIGALGVTGQLSIDPTAFVDVDLGASGTSHNSPGNSDRTNVSSSLAINGTLNLSNAGGAGPGCYKIFSYGSGAWVGTFGTINNGIANTHAKVIDGGSADRSIYVDLYGLASADTSTRTVTLDAIHVGDAFATRALAIGNTAVTAASFTEGLSGTATPNGATVAGSISNVAAGNSTNLALGLTASTTTAGHKTGAVAISLVSDKTNSGWTSDTSLGIANLNIQGDVYEYAQPEFVQQSGAGVLSTISATHYTLAFGDVQVNSGISSSELGILNASLNPVYQDLLGGTFDTSDIGLFGLINFGSFHDVASGSYKSGHLEVSLDTTDLLPGLYSETLYFTPTSSNTSGTSTLATIRLDITASVVPEPGTLVILLLGLLTLLAWRKCEN